MRRSADIGWGPLRWKLRCACTAAALLALALPAAFLQTGCRGLGRFLSRKDVTRVARVNARWIVIDEGKIGMEDGRMGMAARKILLEKLKASPGIRLEEAGDGGEINLTITVMPDMEGREGGEPAPAGEGEEEGAAEGSKPSLEAAYVLKYRGEEGWPLSSAVVIKTDDEAHVKTPALMKSTISELTASLLRQVELLHAPLPEIRAALGDADPQVATLAIQLVGEKKDAASVPDLCRLLDGSEPGDPVREDLVAALEKIGDRRATPHLIKAFSGAEPWQEIQIIRALASTGGEDAKLFLQAVASGHELEPTRRIAAEALKLLP
jgi:hypothetical protein